MTQSIIVYRSPAEAAFWESGMAFPLIVGMVVGVLLAVAAVKLYEKVSPRGRHTGEVAIAAAIIGVVGTMLLM